jgi:hypothetical protein
MSCHPDISGARGWRHLLADHLGRGCLVDGVLGVGGRRVIVSGAWIVEGHGQIQPEADVGAGGLGHAERKCCWDKEEALGIHGVHRI